MQPRGHSSADWRGKGALIGTAASAGAGTGVAAATGKEEAVIHAETAITFTTTAQAKAK